MIQELTLWGASHFATFIAILFTLNVVMVGLVIILENREPERSHGWLLALFAFPVVGLIFYLFFGHNWHRKSTKQRKLAYREMLRSKCIAKEYVDTHPDVSDIEKNLRTLATTITGIPTTFGNRIDVLTDAHIKYPRLISAIENAKTSIDIEYFIFRYDTIGKRIIQILKKKAKEGVHIRFLVDGYGSLGLGAKIFHELRACGIEAHYFAPLTTLLYFFKMNYRDHRKMVVIDKEIGFTGGINIGDEYLGKSARGPWRDTGIEMRGPCVKQMSALFEEAWVRGMPDRRLKKEIDNEQYPDSKEGAVNIIPSGPDTEWFAAVQRTYLEIIHQARESVIIETPYFIPDAGIKEAMINAALRGVDVKLIIPRNTETPVFWLAAMTYVNDLLRAGVRVYVYSAGFLHQKIIIADRSIATIGTCNIDIRSFRMDFEINVLVSAPSTVQHLCEDADVDLGQSTEFFYETFASRPIHLRILESLCRLIAPLL